MVIVLSTCANTKQKPLSLLALHIGDPNFKTVDIGQLLRLNTLDCPSEFIVEQRMILFLNSPKPYVFDPALLLLEHFHAVGAEHHLVHRRHLVAAQLLCSRTVILGWSAVGCRGLLTGWWVGCNPMFAVHLDDALNFLEGDIIDVGGVCVDGLLPSLVFSCRNSINYWAS